MSYLAHYHHVVSILQIKTAVFFENTGIVSIFNSGHQPISSCGTARVFAALSQVKNTVSPKYSGFLTRFLVKIIDAVKLK